LGGSQFPEGLRLCVCVPVRLWFPVSTDLYRSVWKVCVDVSWVLADFLLCHLCVATSLKYDCIVCVTVSTWLYRSMRVRVTVCGMYVVIMYPCI
jgi:hypothetical protein